MRTDEEEEASKCYFRNSFCPFLSVFVRICPFLFALFLSVLKIQGTERTKTDTKHDPPPPPPPPPFTYYVISWGVSK